MFLLDKALVLTRPSSRTGTLMYQVQCTEVAVYTCTFTMCLHQIYIKDLNTVIRNNIIIIKKFYNIVFSMKIN